MEKRKCGIVEGEEIVVEEGGERGETSKGRGVGRQTQLKSK